MTTDASTSLHTELLRLAAETISTSGVHALSLRDVARRAGVSHAAPVHHFGSRKGLLTELASEGFEHLDATLAQVDGDLYDRGAAYVAWGVGNPGRYTVMWQSDLLDVEHPRLAQARRRAWAHLAPDGAGAARRTDALAAFALVHGIVHMVLTGVRPAPPLDGPHLRDLLRRLVPRDDT